MLSDQWSRNNDLYCAFVGDDVDFFIGEEVAKSPDFRPRLKDIRIPLLVIAGRYDCALYPHYQLEFARFAPEAQFLMFEKRANDRGGGAHACDFDG